MTRPPAGQTDGAGQRYPTAAGTARRAVPGSPAEWVTVTGRVSGLLLALAAAERDGLALPEPLAGRTALRAWARLRASIVTAVRTAGPGNGPVSVTVDVADVDVLGGAARTLGLRRCRELASGAGEPVAAILHDEAAVHEIPAAGLVAELARVHGVLDVDDVSGSTAHVVRALWCAGG